MKLRHPSVLLLSVLAFSACGPQKSGSTSSIAVMSADWEVMGPMTAAVEQVSKSPHAKQCDRDSEQIRLEMAGAVDQKQIELAANPDANKYGSSEKLVPYHDSFLSEQALGAPSTKGWQTYKSSWQKLYRYYRKNLRNPPANFWAYMNGEVRSLLSDDLKRIVEGEDVKKGINVRRNMELGKDDIGLVMELNQALKKCLEVQTCVSPDLTAAQLSLITRNDVYTLRAQAIATERETQGKRKALEAFATQTTFDQKMLGFIPNETVSVLRNGKITEWHIPFIALDHSDQDTALITRYVESRWKSENRQVKINFVRKQQTPPVFKLFFENQPGSRAYTIRSDKELHLVPYMDTRSISHEVGHALGFPDHYYAVWDVENCEYAYQYREDDVMSDHTSGSVTSEEWKTLEDSYKVN